MPSKDNSSEDVTTVTFDIKGWFQKNLKTIVWTIILALFIWLALAVREVTSLLLASYATAILLEPIVSRLQRAGVSRTIAIIWLGSILILLLAILLIVAGPWFLEQTSALIKNFPSYVNFLREKLNPVLLKYAGMNADQVLNRFWNTGEEWAQAVNPESIRSIFSAAMSTVLKGYSVTLTIVNLIFLPFFVFYILRDLDGIHKGMLKLVPAHLRSTVRVAGREILDVIYAFCRGQFTICAIGAVLFGIALWLVGLESGFLIGVITGFLNIVPYLGMAIGVVTGTVVAIVTTQSWSLVLLVWLAFFIVNFSQDTFITPRMMGKQMGLHPLGVMLALIVGGHLLGLLGILIAIPAAASLRVLYHHLDDLIELEEEHANGASASVESETSKSKTGKRNPSRKGAS